MAEPPTLRIDPFTGTRVHVVDSRQKRPNLPSTGCPFCVGGLEAPEPYDVFSFTNPTVSQTSETVRVQERGVDRTETVSKFLDLRFGKRFQVQRANLEATIDLFNLLNANHVLLQNQTLGTTFGRPTRILTPRIVRFGITARF